MSLSLRWQVLLKRTVKSIQTKIHKTTKLYNYFSEYGPWKREIDEAVSDSSAKAVARRLDRTLKLRLDVWTVPIALVFIIIGLRISPGLQSFTSSLYQLSDYITTHMGASANEVCKNWANKDAHTFLIFLAITMGLGLMLVIGCVGLAIIVLMWVHLAGRIRTLDARIKVFAHLATRGATPEEDDDIDDAL